MLRCALVTALAAALAAPAIAQAPRQFPAKALRGDVAFVQPPEVLLNGQPARLAPGARIRGTDNMLQLPGSLTGRKLTVHYTIEATSGLLMDVWVLTPDELRNRPWPTTPAQAQAWSFDPLAQKWTRP